MPDEKTTTLLGQARDLLKKGAWIEAARIAERARIELPGESEAWYLEGAAKLAQGQVHQAILLLEGALRIPPPRPEALYYLGLALAHQRRFARAEPLLRQLVELEKENAEGWLALGGVLKELGRMAEALGCHEKASALRPDQPEFHYRLGECLFAAGRHETALGAFRKTLELLPSHLGARKGLGMALQQSHRIPEALREYELLLASKASSPELQSHRLLALHYPSDVDRRRLFEQHLAYGRQLETPARMAENEARRFPNRPDPDKRLRVAFLSPDLRIHSVAFFLRPLLARLERPHFEVFLYHDHPDEDAFTQVLKIDAARWTKTAGLSDAQPEELIRRDAPDVLVDLCGHTNRNRLPLYARRLAPVQISYLGYPDTTGLRSMDYRLTDAIADPEEEADAFGTEKLLRFSPCAWCFWPPPGAPEPADAPCLRLDRTTFGCFNSLSKLSDATVDLWSRLLAAVPGSRLVLKSIRSSPEGLGERFSARGVDPGRLSVLPTSPDVIGHLASYAEMDVALDPFPYNGTTTTCEALWMGVPVLGLRGDRHSARVGASLLSALGQGDWIAATPESFIEKAAELAASPGRLSELRATLRSRLGASILLDETGQARRFGAALRSTWRTWCLRKGPGTGASGAPKP